MSNTIEMKGMALASLDTHALTRLYTNHESMRVSLPRDFMINTLLVREFGQDHYDSHARELYARYPAYISTIKGQLAVK